MSHSPLYHRIQFRPTTLADKPLLEAWDKEPHVIAAAPHDDNEWGDSLEHPADWEQHLIAEIDGRPFGYVYIIDPQLEVSQYWGEVEANLRAMDIWIGPADDLGKGYGTVMMIKVLDLCFANPAVKAMLIDPLASNVDAIRFYLRMGFEFVEERRFDADDCHVYQMTRARWEERRSDVDVD